MVEPVEVFENVREKDDVVLQKVAEGKNDIQLVTSSTSLKRSEVDWCFRKLDDLGLVKVETPEGMVDRVVDGTRQVFQAPKTADLTDLGEEYLDSRDLDLDGYEDMSKKELIRRVQKLEKEVEDVRRSLDVFRRQVQKMLQSDAD